MRKPDKVAQSVSGKKALLRAGRDVKPEIYTQWQEGDLPTSIELLTMMSNSSLLAHFSLYQIPRDLQCFPLLPNPCSTVGIQFLL